MQVMIVFWQIIYPCLFQVFELHLILELYNVLINQHTAWAGTYMYGGSHMQQPGAYVQPSGMAQLPSGQPPQPAGPMQTPQSPYAPALLPVQGQPAGATASAPMPHLVHGHLSYPAPRAVPHPGPPQAPGTQFPPLMSVPLGQPPLLQSPQTQPNHPGSQPGVYSSNIQQQQQQNQQTSSQPSPRQAQNQSRSSSQPSPSQSTPSQAQGQATNAQAGHTPHGNRSHLNVNLFK